MSILTLAKNYCRDLLGTITPKRKTLTRLRARWGAPGSGQRFLASQYFELIRDASPGKWVDDKTWNDLEFPEIFSRMDTTVTPVGSQVLFVQLRKYIDEPSILARRYTIYQELAANTSLREALQLRLSRLDDEFNADLAELLLGKRPYQPARRGLILAWSLASVTMLGLVVVFGWPAWIWLTVLPINTAIIFHGFSRQHQEAEAMKRCAILLDVADKIAAMGNGNPLPHITHLREEGPHRAVVRKVLFWYALMKLPAFSTVFTFLNFAFLAELAIHAGTAERFFQTRSKLVPTFALVGEIDASIALASCLQQYPNYCKPMLVDGRTLDITNGRHPLISNGVTNSIRLENCSTLVTGSNMAGKTTFIKMLASNAILGQTVGFCLASTAIIPRATVMTSIHDAHSVESGKSHYFTEIETINGFIHNNIQDRIKVLAIDEPFSGTNTVERIAVARAVLESLSIHAIVLVTTHDVELEAFLGDRYALYHFQENPDIEGYFDYLLKPGPATDRNAIRLLDRMGFPRIITTNAMAYAKQFSSVSDKAPNSTSESTSEHML